MTAQYSHADSLREYLSGASSDGGAQANPNLSLGGFRSSTEAVSLGILLNNALANVSVLYAGGANPLGAGVLTAVDANTMTWQPNGASQPGPPANFNGVNDVEVVEASGQPGQYLRIMATTPLPIGAMGVTLSNLYDNIYGYDDVSIANAAAGISEYRATIIRNESAGGVNTFQRWLATLGTVQVSNGGGLPATGAGSIVTAGTFMDWPAVGWCRVESSLGVLKEVVYYSSRTNTVLTIPASGRSLLGTSAAAGTLTDNVYPVPGVAIGMDPTGVVGFGSSIQTLAGPTIPPSSVTWNVEVTAAGGLQLGNLGVSQQVGIWAWRQVPPGAVATPFALTKYLDSFGSF